MKGDTIIEKTLFLKKVTKTTFAYEHPSDNTRYYVKNHELDLSEGEEPPNTIKIMVTEA